MTRVALHPEGVDRNTSPSCEKGDTFVALHPEGVDRNAKLCEMIEIMSASPSTRRAWIEIFCTVAYGL